MGFSHLPPKENQCNRAVKMDQSIKCLLNKHGDHSSIPRIIEKCVTGHTFNRRPEEADQKGPGLAGQPA